MSEYRNPKLEFGLAKDELINRLEGRLKKAPEYHIRSEEIASSIMAMMLEKTLMYGGANKEETLKRTIMASYYEGVGRKAKRLPTILDEIMVDDTNYDIRLELLDTIIDIAGYAILSLNSFGEELQNEV